MTNIDLLIELGTLHLPVPDDSFWERESKALAIVKKQSDDLYKSSKMTHETFHRNFDL